MLPVTNVIDNKNVIFKDELLKILPETENASIAVGYFFISGLSIIIQSLKNIDKVRLLISNSTDKPTAEALLEGFYSIKVVESKMQENDFVNSDSEKVIISNSKDNIKKSLEHMSQTVDDKTVVESLIEMMKTKQLEVRIYPKEKLHAKAYIFKSRNQSFSQGVGIVGSSNLSIAGISRNSELNLKTHNDSDLNLLLNWFDRLWKDGLKFTTVFNLILTESWAGKTYSPKDLFLKAAYLEYKDKLEEQHKIDPIWKLKFPKLFPFQRIAVDQSLTAFEAYGGVIIADVVGLGKTYVGIALLQYLQQEYRPLIVCPPSLVPMWEKFCEDYEVDAKVLSKGKLSKQSFELYEDYRYKSRDLVLIDESHNFKNSDSRQYENLHQFMQAQNAKAILLTATPYSNKETDIKNQIMLFHQTPKTFIPPANETDLDNYFRQIKKGNANLVDLLQNIMIRRTRRYVLNQWGKYDENNNQYLQVGDERKYFPKRKMKTERYDINKVYQNKFERIANYLSTSVKTDTTARTLTLARYSIGSYLKDEYKDNQLYKDLGVAGQKLIGLMRTLLLKRMESSLEAFKQSIKDYVSRHEIFLELLNDGMVPIGDVSYKEMYEIAKSDPDSIKDPKTVEEFKKKIQKAGETKYKFEAFDIEKLTKDIQNDIEIFKTIYGWICNITSKTDDKLHRLQMMLDTQYSGKKVLIFTEFATTARYLNDSLKWKGVKKQTDSATGNSVECARKFDPDNNPSNDPRPTQSEEISLLISTDILSEGINLQAGEVVINYDFHWNPTRLIQRAGRVDRIGSKNEFIMVHNFLLDPKMEEHLPLTKQVEHKIDNIQKIIGEDYQILNPDERINIEDRYAIYKCHDTILDREEDLLEPSEFEKILQEIQIKEPEYWEKIKKIPKGIRSSENIKSGGQLLLACESGTKKSGKIKKYYLINRQGEIKTIKILDALKRLESKDDDIHPIPADYDKLVSIGWKKFVEDTEQIQAGASSINLGNIQRWVIAKLIKMNDVKEFSVKKDMIETLLEAYSIPILKGKLRKELLKIKKSDLDDSELLKHISILYINYNLQDQKKQYEKESKSPRILYSKYVGD